jgi:hypothetical protein
MRRPFPFSTPMLVRRPVLVNVGTPLTQSKEYL